MGRLDGKTAAITGAAQGIGAIMAKRLAEEGANVVVSDVVDTAKTVTAITDAGGKAIGIHVDVTSDDDATALVAAAEKEFGALDILVNKNE